MNKLTQNKDDSLTYESKTDKKEIKSCRKCNISNIHRIMEDNYFCCEGEINSKYCYKYQLPIDRKIDFTVSFYTSILDGYDKYVCEILFRNPLFKVSEGIVKSFKKGSRELAFERALKKGNFTDREIKWLTKK